jgi:hypothetical protein
MMNTTINGQKVQARDRFTSSSDIVNCIEAIRIRGVRDRDTRGIGLEIVV